MLHEDESWGGVGESAGMCPFTSSIIFLLLLTMGLDWCWPIPNIIQLSLFPAFSLSLTYVPSLSLSPKNNSFQLLAAIVYVLCSPLLPSKLLRRFDTFETLAITFRSSFFTPSGKSSRSLSLPLIYRSRSHSQFPSSFLRCLGPFCLLQPTRVPEAKPTSNATVSGETDTDAQTATPNSSTRSAQLPSADRRMLPNQIPPFTDIRSKFNYPSTAADTRCLPA